MITAFIIESGSSLNNDPVLVYLDAFLRQSQTLKVQDLPSLPSPSSGDSALNALWFVSLTISIFGAYICVLGKQLLQAESKWLHQLRLDELPGGLSQEAETARVVTGHHRCIRLRNEWERRKVMPVLHHVFDWFLPFLFQISLGLFFIGLIIRFSSTQTHILFPVLGSIAVVSFLLSIFLFFFFARPERV